MFPLIAKSRGRGMISSTQLKYSDREAPIVWLLLSVNIQAKPRHMYLHWLTVDDTAPPPVGEQPDVP